VLELPRRGAPKPKAGEQERKAEARGRWRGATSRATLTPGTPLPRCYGHARSAVDTAFVGSYGGVSQLAAMGPATMVADLTVILLGWHAGATLNFGLRAESSSKRARVYGASLVIGVLMGIAVMACHLASPEQLVGVFRPDAALVGDATAYVRIRALALPLYCLSNSLYGMCAARKDAISPLVVAGVSCVLNGVLDYALVGVLGWGIHGAAWATMASQALAPAAYLLRPSLRRDLRNVAVARAKDYVPFAYFAAPVIFVTVSTLSCFAFQQAFASQLGLAVAAAHKIAIGVFCVAAFLGDPVSLTMQSFLPAVLAEQGPRAARQFALWVCRVSLAVGLTAGLLVALSLNVGGVFFTADASVRSLAASVWPQLLCSIAFLLPLRALNGAAVACGDLLFYASATAMNAAVFAGVLFLLLGTGGGGTASSSFAALWTATVGFYVAGAAQFGWRLLVWRGGKLQAQRAGALKAA